MVKRSQHYSSDLIPLKHDGVETSLNLTRAFSGWFYTGDGGGEGGGGGGFSETVKAKYYNQTWYTN